MFVQVPSLSIWFTPIGMYQQQMWIRWGWQFLMGSGRKQSGRIGICVMSLPRKTEVFLQLGQSTHPWLSAALDGLSGDIGRLCGCISLKPGVCSCRQERADIPPHPALHRVQKNTYIWKNTHSIHEEVWACFAWLCGLFRDCSYLSSWGLIVLSLPLHHELQQSPLNATKSVSVCVWISGLCNYDLTRLPRQKRYDGEIICKSKKKKRWSFQNKDQ